MNEAATNIERICQAISEKRLLRILYAGHDRIVEPHLVGQKTNGNDALSAWQVRGYSRSGHEPPWRNYLIRDIEEVEILEETFDKPRPGYNPDDSTMSQIYCRL